MANFLRNRRLPQALRLGTLAGVSLVTALVWTAAPAAQSAAQSAQRDQRNQTVFIGVLNKDGAPPATLTTKDVSIREDGNVREILTVGPATTPMQVAVLVDTSQVSRDSIPDLRASVKAFGAAIWAKSPDSEISLYTFGERPVQLVDYTTSAPVLDRGVDKLFAASGAGAYFIDAVIESADALAKRTPVRGVIVAFVDENGPEFSNRRHQQVFDALARARASLWTITRQAFNSTAMTSETRERASVVGDVTTRSGGRGVTVFAPSALRDRFTDIADALHAQFAVTYGRPETLIPPDRLEIRLTLEGYRLTAPRWTNQ
ncbi:MAG: VWA domain-containing protein [Acidobacteria bacterium]|nr:VWA domain-containing protein [Acidobacteriota bacterium]